MIAQTTTESDKNFSLAVSQLRNFCGWYGVLINSVLGDQYTPETDAEKLAGIRLSYMGMLQYNRRFDSFCITTQGYNFALWLDYNNYDVQGGE